ncbi:MAG TPA: PA14 domain-containing protein [Candidatus Paceibacterota bacterium]|nr:PA14 domain-containing protein [Verrucomicrobiota bacterium]HRY48008.1 PA14 domain-containing protein [Candidatus Paceibacterota bacterium]
MNKFKQRGLVSCLVAGALAVLANQANAGSVTYNFDSDPTSVIEIIGNNTTPWQATGGNPASGGFLALTYAFDSIQCGFMFPDLDNGKVVTSFKFTCDLRIGNSEGDRGADGFAVSFARGNDPFVANPSMGNLAATLPEAGTVTGIAIGFDTWSGNTLPDGGDIEGIIVRVDNKTVLKQAMPTRHGACDDATSLQTGPRDPDFWAELGDIYSLDAVDTLCWAPLSVELDADAKLTVIWKGKTLLDKYQTSYFPTPGRLIFTGRTGGENEATHVDNIVLTTTAIELDNVAPTMPTNFKAPEVGAGRVLLTWDAATDNSGKVAYEVERDGTVISGIFSDTKYEDFTVKTKTTYSYKVRAVDTSSNKSAFTAAVSATTVDFVDVMGFLTAQVYDGNTATDVYSLTSDPKYPDSPDRTVFVTGLDTPNGFADNYGLRLAGVIMAPETAQYDFFIRSDDASQFFLNKNGEAIPDALADLPIAEETGCCEAFKEPDPSMGQPYETTSEPISLVAGKKYGFLLLLKEGGGGDFAQVAWRKVGDTTSASTLTPISGVFVYGKADPVGSRVTITQPPQDTAVAVGKTATFSVAVDSYSPYTTTVLYQWYRNGSLIPGAQTATYTIPVTTQADNGAKFKVMTVVPGTNTTSVEATLTITSDSAPPVVVGAGAIASETGSTFDVGVTFDEPVDETSAKTQANYTLSAGTISGIKFYKGSPGVVLTVSGLTVGNTYTVTVKNVADLYGNAITSADKSFKVSAMKWGVVGGKELSFGNGVLPVAENGFDIYSDGIGEWAAYDEATFVYEEVTGNFDKVLRVEFQDSSSQWARAGLVVRDVTNFGVDRASQEGGLAGRYQKVHVNPVKTAMGTAGNNAWEGNRRLATGDQTTTAGGGGIPQYPNAWCRLQRTNDLFIIYRSDDGQTWTQLGTTTFTEPMPAKLYVGPEFSPENGNIGEETGLRGMWVAKMRDYGNYPAVSPVTPEVAISLSGTTVTITYKGTLQSADSVTGPYTDVAGAVSPYSVSNPSGVKFYRAKK